jgi:molybdopterin converting factor small subunit
MERPVHVSVRLFGLRGGDSRLTHLPTSVPAGMTVRALLDELRSQAAPTDRLAVVDPEALLTLINGRPVQYLQGWDTRISEQDEITFLLKTAGG